MLSFAEFERLKKLEQQRAKKRSKIVKEPDEDAFDKLDNFLKMTSIYPEVTLKW
eukprot:TRINITY_DN3185_c0_g1_i1.p2 TRINITY_DN3185_c0_g1~~TRINITY_DN3185_c0_g1_i1.p2  ORF type:complete len:54 (+),score=13.22 TRINITY_DN3185_c0_g1_i1:97-258(+)